MEDDEEAEQVKSLIFLIYNHLTRVALVALADIDWHDYAIVQTTESIPADANSELPPPTATD